MTTYLFQGQGSQFKGMGEGLFDEFPHLIELADELLGYSIKSLCLKDENQNLDKTEFTQPALYVVNALSYEKKLQSTESKPDYLIGHSLGEINALQAAGVLSFEDGLRVVIKRGQLMSRAESGAMAAILKVSEQVITQCFDEFGLSGIDIANYNSPNQIVISGVYDQVNAAMEPIEKAGGIFVPLNTSGAFHSRQMREAKKTFKEHLQNFKFLEPKIPVISNKLALPYEHLDILETLADQMDSPVRWMQSINYLLEQGETDFEELGADDVLTKLVVSIRDVFDKKQSTNLTEPSKNSAKEILLQGIERWNTQYPVGTKVLLKGSNEEYITRAKAIMLFGHREAIYLHGFNGYFSLGDVSPVLSKATEL
jgi:malonyl CoA-acyl carrier protein transacylase